MQSHLYWQWYAAFIKAIRNKQTAKAAHIERHMIRIAELYTCFPPVASLSAYQRYARLDS